MTGIKRVHTKFKSKSWVSNSIDLVLFNLRALSKKWVVLAMISIFFIIGLTTPAVFVPYYGSIPIFFLTYLIIPIFIILGWNGYNVRNSTMYLNINSSGLGRKTFYIGQIITVSIVGNVLTLFFWPLVVIIGHLQWFNLDWSTQMFTNEKWVIQPFVNGTWILIFYEVQVTIGVTFAIYFATQSIISNHNTYYIVVITLVLLSVIFGGAINDYFLQTPGGLSYSAIIKTSLDNGVDYVKVDGQFYVLDSAWIKVEEAMWKSNEIKAYGGTFPTTIFIPTLFFPFFGVGQFGSAAVGLQSTQHLMWNNENINIVADLNNISDVKYTLLDNIQGEQNWYDWFTVNPLVGDGWMWFCVLVQPYAVIFICLFIGLVFSKFRKK